MTTSQTQTTHPSITDEISESEFAYCARELQNEIFNQIITAFSQERREGRLSRAELARRIRRSPDQITHWFSGPSNMTEETISRILRGMDARLATSVEFLRDIAEPNDAHPLAAHILHMAPVLPARVEATTKAKTIPTNPNPILSSPYDGAASNRDALPTTARTDSRLPEVA